MDDRIHHALARDRTIDITTQGRNTGQLHRTELWFHHIDGHVYITGAPGPRDWYANLLAHPEFTFHLKQSTKADLPARATPILDRARRRAIITSIDQKLGGSQIWTRGLRVVRWSPWNSWVSELVLRLQWGRDTDGDHGPRDRASEGPTRPP